MVEQIEGNAQLLLDSEDDTLFQKQAEAQASGDVSKTEADYQNTPKNEEQCSECSMFVPGFPHETAGYCTKVKSFQGPEGMIFLDGWCKFFESLFDNDDDLDLDDED